ncbi:MAG: hypothetical protein AB2693_13470 [Candidatus Thiodiazotropha sp.]
MGVFAEVRLPSKEVFYSKVSDEHISDEDYDHARKVWSAFACTTLGTITTSTTARMSFCSRTSLRHTERPASGSTALTLLIITSAQAFHGMPC